MLSPDASDVVWGFFFAGWSDAEDPSIGRFLDSDGEVNSETAMDMAPEPDSSVECCEGLGGNASFDIGSTPVTNISYI